MVTVKDMVTLEKSRELDIYIYTRSKNIIHSLKTKINICYIKLQFATQKNSLLLQELPIVEGCIGQRWVFNRERPTECVHEVC